VENIVVLVVGDIGLDLVHHIRPGEDREILWVVALAGKGRDRDTLVGDSCLVMDIREECQRVVVLLRLTVWGIYDQKVD
jgi:hypothetical protein